MQTPAFDTPEFLRDHAGSILRFYELSAFDPAGGFFHHFRDDGSVYDRSTRHLVSSTRFVFNHANAWLRGYGDQYRAWVRHGVDFLLERHRMPDGHFAWILNGATVEDGRAMAYGHAFVMLAGAWAARAGLDDGAALVSDVWDLMEHLFWEEGQQAYADERDATLQTLSPYRGQNANMHMVEALLAAFEATGEGRYLDRAEAVARRFTIDHADAAGGQIWEHYSEGWSLDWDYNRDRPDDLFKPWGFQPGHQVEWAKLLLQIDRHRNAGWHRERAVMLYDRAFERGWDAEYGGLVYGYAPDGGFADSHKYFWVMAEAIAAAWRLYAFTGEERFRGDYMRLWGWSWRHLVDHDHGGWFRITDRAGNTIEPWKSPAGKVDYHTLGACWHVLDGMTGNALQSSG